MVQSALTPPTEAVIYCRISPNPKTRADRKGAALDPKYERKSLSLETQLAVCRRYCELKGYTVVGEFDDPAISGKDSIEDRPGLQKVIEACRGTNVVVVVHSLSRLSRRQRLTWELLDDRGEYRLLMESATEPFSTSTAMGRAVLGMIAIFAQLEADLCSERMIAALAARVEKGLPVGARPLALERPEVVGEIQALYATGKFTLRTLADHLNAAGVQTKHGKRWHATSVGRTLKQTVLSSSAA